MIRTTLLAAACGISLAAFARADEAKRIEVPAGDLTVALESLAKQSGIELIYESSQIRGLKTDGIAGEMTAQDAVVQLLQGTSLTVTSDSSGAILISRTPVGGGPEATLPAPQGYGPAAGYLARNGQAGVSDTPGVSSVAPAPASVPGEPGVLSGRVTEAASGSGLAGAMVRIDGTHHSTRTDELGRFRLPGVPPGEHQLTISYLGLDPVQSTIAVEAGKTVSVDLQVRGVDEALNEIVVFGTRSARAQALNQQRTADNFASVVSSDMLGNFPGTTLSEALRRVEGVTFLRDPVTGDGTNVMIRGLHPDMNAVKLNGLHLPVTDGIARSADLSNLLADSVSKIVINKTLLPSHDSAGTGGLIEIETKSPLDRPERYLNFGAENAWKESGFGEDWLGFFTMSGTFGEDHDKGISLSVQYRSREAVNVGYSVVASRGLYLPLESDGSPSIYDPGYIDPRIPFPYESGVDQAYVTAVTNDFSQVESRTYAATLSGAWQIGNHTSLRLDVQRAESESDTLSRSSWLNASVRHALLPVVQLGGEERQVLAWDGTASASQSYWYAPDVTNETDTYSFRGESTVGKLALEYTLGYARGETRSPRSASFNPAFGGFFNDVPLDPAFIQPGLEDPIEGRIITPFGLRRGRGYQLPMLTPEGLAFFNDPGTYELSYASRSKGDGYNERSTAELSARYQFERPHLRYVELGLDYERAEFANYIVASSLSGNCGFFEPCPTLADLGISLSESNLRLIGVSGDSLNLISAPGVRDFIRRMPDLVDQGLLIENTQPVDPRLRDQFTREEQFAPYLQAQVDFGRLEIIGGVRLSRVDVRAVNLTSPQFIDENFAPDPVFEAEFTRLLDQSDVGTDLLPRVLANFRWNDRLILRGGYFMSVARPSIDQLSDEQYISLILAPFFGPAANQPMLSVTEGNPSLKPATTHNFDLAAEYYDDRIGVMRVGLFYKDIDNLLEANETVFLDVPDHVVLPDHEHFRDLPENLYVSVYRPINSPHPAQLWGLELALERQFSSLPGAWSGLGALANYTYTDSDKKQTINWTYSPMVDEQGEFVRDPFSGEILREEVVVPLHDGSFFMQPRHSGTAALTYNKSGYDASLAWTYQERASQGASAHRLDFYSEAVETLDLRMARRFDSRFGDVTVSFEGVDLLKGRSSPDLELSEGGARGVPKVYRSAGFLGGRSFRLGVSASF